MLNKDTEGWGGWSLQTEWNCMCQGGEQELSWEQWAWAEDCMSWGGGR